MAEVGSHRDVSDCNPFNICDVGYGAASPRTTEGKMFSIFYGLIGCSSGILFFNLFLERIITLLAFIMRARHERKQRQRAAAAAAAAAAAGSDGTTENSQVGRRGSQDSMEDSSLDAWKPSVYWVMFYLTIASVIVAFLGAVMFMEVEEWNYSDSLYFCFISFATIGFGDFVSAQRSVTCCSRGNCTNAQRRNTVSPSRLHKHSIKRVEGDIDSVYGSETERKLSGEMVSMREYISTNKAVLPGIKEQVGESVLAPVSLAVMQKQLYETAQLGRGHASSPHPRPAHDERFTPGQVGPLAIASSKLCDSMS
ncbi:potassium channel subfamily K member 13-like [Penaeus indicus]|uniref:potassium channel subfamily K member 13-like n=1 Tax=Penaeus indicus TaxID=29960 RepID=UPI00300DADA4